MPGQRLVELRQSLAIPDPATLPSSFTRPSFSIQIRIADPRNFDLHDRTWLPIFHLDQEDPPILVGLHLGNACRYRTCNGIISFRACNDRFESCRLWYRNEERATGLCRFYDGRKHRATSKRVRISPRRFSDWRVKSTHAQEAIGERPSAQTLFLILQK